MKSITILFFVIFLTFESYSQITTESVLIVITPISDPDSFNVPKGRVWELSKIDTGMSVEVLIPGSTTLYISNSSWGIQMWFANITIDNTRPFKNINIKDEYVMGTLPVYFMPDTKLVVHIRKPGSSIHINEYIIEGGAMERK